MHAVIAHGWSGYPGKGWFPWLKKELEKRGFTVNVPQFPLNDRTIKTWVSVLEDSVGTPDKHTFLIGHSIGCQTIMRYLEKLPEEVQIGGAVFVAGFLEHLGGHEDMSKINAWVDQPIDLEKVRKHIPKNIAIFSDDDPYVSAENYRKFQDILGSEFILEHGKKHMSGDTGTMELPSVLKAVLKLSGKE